LLSRIFIAEREVFEFPLSKLSCLAHSRVQAAAHTGTIVLSEALVPLIHKLFLITEEISFVFRRNQGMRSQILNELLLH